MYELAQELTARRHRVTVLTTFPQYNLTESSKKQIEKYPTKAEENGIRVIRIKTLPIHNVNHIIRGIGQIFLPFLFFRGTRSAGPQDISVVYSPPLPLGLAAYLIKRREGTPFIFNVQDLFPQNAIDLGALRQSILIKFFRWMEDFIYRKADHISVHSGGNRDYVLSRGIRSDKVSVIHNWVDLVEFKIDGVPNPIREKNDLSEKFIIFFGGVMGYAQDLETVVDCAHLLKNHQQIIFLLLGDGAEKKSLVEKSQSLGLTNIKFLPFVSKEEYPSWVNASDVGLVTLKSSMKTPVVPSKILGYMAAGKPILASLNQESDGIKIVEKANCGINVPAGNPAAMADAILKLLANQKETQAMGQHGRSYAEEHFSIDACIDEYEEIFRRIAK
jgi:glycosyltransferase involved in cell wall biosynthesis